MMRRVTTRIFRYQLTSIGGFAPVYNGVVGSSALMNGTGHAFYWTRAEGMIDLNTLLPLNSGWVLTEANGVNDRGQITGAGLHNGLSRAFRLGPMEIVIVP